MRAGDALPGLAIFSEDLADQQGIEEPGELIRTLVHLRAAIRRGGAGHLSPTTDAQQFLNFVNRLLSSAVSATAAFRRFSTFAIRNDPSCPFFLKSGPEIVVRVRNDGTQAPLDRRMVLEKGVVVLAIDRVPGEHLELLAHTDQESSLLLGRPTAGAEPVETVPGGRGTGTYILDQFRKLGPNLVEKNLAETMAEARNPYAGRRKRLEVALFEEQRFLAVSVLGGPLAGPEVEISYYVPASLEPDIFVPSQSEEFSLQGGPDPQGIGFGDDANGALPVRINRTSLLKHNLIGEFVHGRYHGQDDAPLAFHVRLHEIVDQTDVASTLLLVLRVDETWQIHHGQLGLGGARDLDPQNVLRKGSAPQGIEAHGLLGLLEQPRKLVPRCETMVKAGKTVAFVGRPRLPRHLCTNRPLAFALSMLRVQLTSDTDIDSSAARRRITSVANLVQRVSLRGNGTPETASRTELLPLDWSPQTISCGRAVYSLSPSARRASITSRS